MSTSERQDEVRFIRVQCPRLTCLLILAVPEETRGKLVRCRGCGMTVRVPRHVAADTAMDAT